VRISEIVESRQVTDEAHGWAARGISKVVYRKAYQKAAELTKKMAEKDGYKQSMVYYANELLRMAQDGDRLDARGVADFTEAKGDIRKALGALAMVIAAGSGLSIDDNNSELAQAMKAQGADTSELQLAVDSGKDKAVQDLKNKYLKK